MGSLEQADIELYDLEYFRKIVDSSLDGIIVTDEMGRFEFANNSLFSIIGWQKEEIIGQCFTKITPENKMDIFVKSLSEIKQGMNKSYETTVLTKNGETKYIHVSHALTEIKGKKKIVSIVKDITGTRRLELALVESEARYRNLFENAIVPMYVLDSEGKILEMNNAGIQILGCTKEEAIGTNVFQWLAPESRKIGRLNQEKKLAGEPENHPAILEIVNKQGEHRWLEVETSEIRGDGRIKEVHGIARNITENIRLKQKIRKSNKQLDLLCHLLKGTSGGKSRALILKQLKDGPYNANQMARALNVDYKTVRYHLDVLLKNEIIKVDKDKKYPVYFLPEITYENLNEVDPAVEANFI